MAEVRALARSCSVSFHPFQPKKERNKSPREIMRTSRMTFQLKHRLPMIIDKRMVKLAARASWRMAHSLSSSWKPPIVRNIVLHCAESFLASYRCILARR